MSDPFARYDAFPHWTPEHWQPAFPPGRLDRIYLHWSGGDYETVYRAYHYCVVWDGERAYVVETSDLRGNMRDVYATPGPYAAHTLERNSFAAGVSIMGMKDAQPNDFGTHPLVDAAVGALCAVAARIARAYAIPIDAAHVMTHAEAAIEDGYFGAGSDDVRWDIARLHPSPAPLVPADARETGALLRERIAG